VSIHISHEILIKNQDNNKLKENLFTKTSNDQFFISNKSLDERELPVDSFEIKNNEFIIYLSGNKLFIDIGKWFKKFKNNIVIKRQSEYDRPWETGLPYFNYTLYYYENNHIKVTNATEIFIQSIKEKIERKENLYQHIISECDFRSAGLKNKPKETDSNDEIIEKLLPSILPIYECFSKEKKNDVEFNLKLVKSNYKTYLYMNDEMCKNKELAEYFLRNVKDELRLKDEYNKIKPILKFFSKDKEFLKKILLKNWYIFKYFDENKKNDIEFIKIFLTSYFNSKNKKQLKKLSKEQQKIVKATVKDQLNEFEYSNYTDGQKLYIDFLTVLIKLSKCRIGRLTIEFYYGIITPEFIPNKLKYKNKEIITKLLELQRNLDFMKHMDSRLKKDISFAKKLIRINPEVLSYFDEEVRDNYDIALLCIKKGGLLKNVSKRLTDNEEIKKLALKNNFNNISYASKRLRNDAELIYSCLQKYKEVRMFPSTLEKCGNNIKNNPNIMLKLIKKNSDFFLYTGKKLMKDVEYVKKAININIDIIKNLDYKYRNNEEIMLYALKKDSMLNDTIYYVGEELLKDKQFILKIIKIDGEYLLHASEDIRNNQKFIDIANKHKKEYISDEFDDLPF